MDIENENLLANLKPDSNIKSFFIDLYTFNKDKENNYQNICFYISKMVRARFASRDEYQKMQYFHYLKQDNFYENYINYTIKKEIENIIYLYNIDSDGNLVRRPETMIFKEDVRDSNYDKQVKMIVHLCCGPLNKQYGSAKWLYKHQNDRRYISSNAHGALDTTWPRFGSGSLIDPRGGYNNDFDASVLREILRKNSDQYFTNLTQDGLRQNIRNSYFYESGEKSESESYQEGGIIEPGKCKRKNVLSLYHYPLGTVEVLMPTIKIMQSVDIQRIQDGDLNKFLSDIQNNDSRNRDITLYTAFYDLYDRKLLQTNRIHGSIPFIDYKSDTYSFAYQVFEKKENEIPMQNIYKIALMEKKIKGSRKPFFFEDCPETIRNIFAGKIILLDSKAFGGYIYAKLVDQMDELETKNGSKLDCILLKATKDTLRDAPFPQQQQQNIREKFLVSQQTSVLGSIWKQESLTQIISVDINSINKIFSIVDIDTQHLIVGEKYTLYHNGEIRLFELKQVSRNTWGENVTFEDDSTNRMSDSQANQNNAEGKGRLDMTLSELKHKFIHASEKVEFAHNLTADDMILSNGRVYIYTGRFENRDFLDYNFLCTDIQENIELIIPYKRVHGYVSKSENWIEHIQYSLLLDDNSGAKIYKFLPRLYQLLVSNEPYPHTDKNPSGFIGKDIKKGRIVNDEIMRKYLYQYGYHDTYATTHSLLYHLYHFNTYRIIKNKIEKDHGLRGVGGKQLIGTIPGKNSTNSDRMEGNATRLGQEIFQASKGTQEQESETPVNNIHTRIRDIILSITDPIQKRRILKKYISDYCFIFKNEAQITTESGKYKQDCGLWLMVPDTDKNIMIPVLCIHHKYQVEDDRDSFEKLLIKDPKSEHFFCQNCHEILQQVDFDTFEGYDKGGEDGAVQNTRESSRILNGNREFAGYSFDPQMKEFLNTRLQTTDRNKSREKTLNQVRRDLYGVFDGKYLYDIFLEEYAKLSKITPLKEDPGYLLQHKSEWDTLLDLFKKINLNLTTEEDTTSIEQLEEEKKIKENTITQFTDRVKKYKSILKKKPTPQEDIASIAEQKDSALKDIYKLFNKNPPPEAITDSQKEFFLKSLGKSLGKELEQVLEAIWYKSSTTVEKVRISIRILLKYWYAQTCFHKIVLDESYKGSITNAFPAKYNIEMNQILDLNQVPRSLLEKLTAINIVQQWYGNFKKNYDVKKTMEDSGSSEAKRRRLNQSQASLKFYRPNFWDNPLLYQQSSMKGEQDLFYEPRFISQYDPKKVTLHELDEFMKFQTTEYIFADKYQAQNEEDFKEWTKIWRYNTRLFRDYVQQHFYLNLINQPKHRIFEYDSSSDCPFAGPQTLDIRPEKDYKLATNLRQDLEDLIKYYVETLEKNAKQKEELIAILKGCGVSKTFIGNWMEFYDNIFKKTEPVLEYDEENFKVTEKKKYSALQLAKMIFRDFTGFITFANRIFFATDGNEYAELTFLEEYREKERQEYIAQFEDCFGDLENMYDFDISNDQFVYMMDTYLNFVRINKYENDERLVLWANRFVQKELVSYFKSGSRKTGERFNCCKVKIFKIYFDRIMATRPELLKTPEEILLPHKHKGQAEPSSQQKLKMEKATKRYNPMEQIIAQQERRKAGKTGVRLVNLWELDEYIENMNVDRETNEHEMEQQDDELAAISGLLNETERSVYSYARVGDDLNPLDQVEAIFERDYMGDENQEEQEDD